MPLKPWYRVATPRADLREGKPLDAAEFAVHLDQVRDGRGPDDYKNPERFFDRTYLTRNLTDLAAEMVRRLSGEVTQTSAVFNMTTQFGGGKTHALTLLYHLAKHGPAANGWAGVGKILAQSGMPTVPEAATAVFVGTEFDSLTGRGGDDGTPLRRTPWGELAWQLGAESFAAVAEHEREFIEPKGDVIRKMLPQNKPSLILMDEIINYVSTYRRRGYHNSLYNFIQALSETARGQENVVLVVSIPASELEYTAEDQADEQRFKKMLDRVGKPLMMSAEAETSEIIRRRLFEWDPQAVSQEGKVILNRDAVETCIDYARWVVDHRQQLPSWFPIDNAREAFLATFPFHPAVLSVFERKWQALPRFQRTRGVLRLLALWVARAYQDGFKNAQRDPLIGLGSAPLDDPLFRSAAFEQLGESLLEVAVTTDICGKPDSHATRLDMEALDAIKKARLHRKVATTVFFESNGGQTTHTAATVPEIRLAVAEPDLDIGNIETVLETLSSDCYYLSVERNHYRFSLSPNLNKILADRRANIALPKIEERVRAEVQSVFKSGAGIERIYFPEKSSQVSDRAVLTLYVLAPEHSIRDERTIPLIESMTREAGTSNRTYKSALIWCVADDAAGLQEDARKLIAWEEIQNEAGELRLDDSQRRQLEENLRKAQRDLRESVWRTYKNIVLLGKDNKLQVKDLGLIHSSAADTLVQLITNRLIQDGEIVDAVSPNFLTRNWPPAFKEWSTKAARDAFFASPHFPRLLKSDAIKDTIAKGVSNNLIAYVGKDGDDYEPFIFGRQLGAGEIELTDDMFIIRKDTAEAYKKSKERPPVTAQGEKPADQPVDKPNGPGPDKQLVTPPTGNTFKEPLTPLQSKQLMLWDGDIPSQKWMNFYTKVLSKFASGKGLKLTLHVEVAPEGGLSAQKIEETKVALRELGLSDDVNLK